MKKQLKDPNVLYDTTEYGEVCKGNTLLCPVGLPRCGKSMWARGLGVPIVCPDAIRRALTGRRWYTPIEHQVWATARTMVRALFWAGHKVVILDATNWSRRTRDNFRPSPDCDWRREFIRFYAPADLCKARARITYPDLVEVIVHFAEVGCEKIHPEEEGLFITPAHAKQLCKGEIKCSS